MKRKSFDEFLYSPSKSRRLDCDVLEGPRSFVSEVLEPQRLASTSTNNEVLSSPDERAIVLYDPANTPLFRSPTSPDFTAILNSDLIPGLRDLICWPARKMCIDNKLASSKITEISNNNLAVVPWVPSQFAQASLSQPIEEAPEMMDTDDISSIDFGGN
ncbi:DBH-like monooxygenase [Melia azedarach]|uniref:DBH-like monooxygenase n=1 Tax=Melia azedarach TaxID=155640 RepID=A0ACC1X8M9_MELAZ|nr:DBH-like monooxygenase [Melia azedarach]